MRFEDDELKIMSVAGPMFVKMLREREQKIMKKLYGEFRSGKTDLLTLIAEFAVVREQLNELITALARDNQE